MIPGAGAHTSSVTLAEFVQLAWMNMAFTLALVHLLVGIMRHNLVRDKIAEIATEAGFGVQREQEVECGRVVAAPETHKRADLILTSVAGASYAIDVTICSTRDVQGNTSRNLGIAETNKYGAYGVTREAPRLPNGMRLMPFAIHSETGMFAQAAVALMRILADAKTGREPMVHRPVIASSRYHHLLSAAGQIGHCMCLGDFRMWVSCCAA